MKKKYRLLSCLLVFMLGLTGCTTDGYNIPQPQAEVVPEHSDLNFEDMSYERPDIDAINQKINDLLAKVVLEGNQEEILKGYDEILNDLKEVDQMESLASIKNNIDLSDSYYEEEYQFLTSAFVKLDNRMNELTEAILTTSYKDAFVKKMGEDFIERYEKNKKLNSPEIEELSEQETALINEYSKTAAKEYTTMINGQSKTIDDLDFNKQEDIDGYYDIYEQKNKELGTIYKKLVSIRVEIAKKLGYENYTDYAYDLLGRDFSKEDAEKFEEAVLEYVAPLAAKMDTKYQEKLQKLDTSEITVESGFSYLKTALKQEFPKAMQDAYDYMQKHHLYQIDDDSNMLHAGYTTIIGNEPFLFINTSDYKDPSTLFHEFGHYYNFYLMGGTSWNDGNNLDIAEIHSQAFELLMFEYYDEIYGSDAKLMEIKVINDMLNSILQGCIEDEFQRKVFENPDISLEEMNTLHGQIYQKYMGYPLEYEWVDIHHHFETPFYYISYATSAVSSLELWLVGTKNREDALNAYRNMTQNTLNVDYLDALKDSGFSNPFTSKVIKNISSEIKREFL